MIQCCVIATLNRWLSRVSERSPNRTAKEFAIPLFGMFAVADSAEGGQRQPSVASY